MSVKSIFKKLPVLGPLATRLYRRWVLGKKPFTTSQSYWVDRYQAGGNSGEGSYDKLAEFKAEVLNAFVRQREVASVIEYGCGDGNQLTLAQYPQYIGFDVSPQALDQCRALFAADPTKQFLSVDDYAGQTAELTLSLDVVYHLIEDATFQAYMQRLFNSATRFVIVYASNHDDNPTDQAPHVRHRKFTAWVEAKQPAWALTEHLPNRYPLDAEGGGSFADFYIFSRQA